MPDNAGEWILVVLVVLTYSLLISVVLLWKKTRAWVVGYSGHRPLEGQEPVYLPIAAAAWVVVTISSFSIVKAYAKPAHVGLSTVHVPGAIGNSSHAFFQLGWNTGLAIFGLEISTWWQYSILCIYQLTRAVLGSMIQNIFMPFLSATINSESAVSQDTKKTALTGHGLCTLFVWWSNLTDILISASQVDLAIFNLIAREAADVGYGVIRIAAVPRGQRLALMSAPTLAPIALAPLPSTPLPPEPPQHRTVRNRSQSPRGYTTAVKVIYS